MNPEDPASPLAELIFVGGPIVTMDEGAPTAEAVAVADGRILAVGPADEVLGLQGPDTKVVDLAGATLMPSFIDAHGHFMNAPQVVRWANVAGPPVGPVTSIAEIVPVLHEHVERLGIGPGEWIIGYGYDRSNYADGREATVDDLDPAFPDNPIMLIHSSNHGAVLNTAGFVAAGITAETPTPDGGLIVRKPDTNEPAGFIMETAFLPLFASMPKPNEEAILATLGDAQRIYASVGVTTVQEGATHAADIRLLRTADRAGLLVLDIVTLPLILDMRAVVRDIAPDFTGGRTELPADITDAFGHYDGHVKLQGIKFILDGSPQGKTAFWTEPLLTPGPGGEADWRGAPLFPPELIFSTLAEVFDKGVQVFAHANGDASIDLLIEGARRAGVTADEDRRTVVIHSQCMRPDQLDSYAELGLSPSFFTAHTFFWGSEHMRNLGPERASFLSPMASATARGIRSSNHCDFSVTPMDPMRMIWSAVTRQSREGPVIGPDERVDRRQALAAITIDAAWQIREEATKGTITAGKRADLVVLDANPLTAEIDAVLDIGVVRTYKDGHVVYERSA